LQQGQGEPGSLAGAGLGSRENVAAFENDGDCLGLDRGGLRVAFVGHGTYELGAQAERFK
jgi:hypothetical protein